MHTSVLMQAVTKYGTDLTQRRTRARVIGYHSLSTRTRSSVPYRVLLLEGGTHSNESLLEGLLHSLEQVVPNANTYHKRLLV